MLKAETSSHEVQTHELLPRVHGTPKLLSPHTRAHLADVLQEGLLVPTELSHFGPCQQLTGLHSLIFQGRQAPCKHSLTFGYGSKEEIIRKLSTTARV